MASSSLADEDWQWPEEKPSSSTYYNTAFGGTAPPPRKLQSKVVDEDHVPSKRITQVRNYSWSDDTNAIRVYVPIPGLARDGVSVEICEESVDVRAATPLYGTFALALRRLFDKVDTSKSSFKVLEKKEKIIIVLAKFPPPGYGESAFVNFKPWHKLHHGGTNNIDVLDDFEKERLMRSTTMNQASTPAVPKLQEPKRR